MIKDLVVNLSVHGTNDRARDYAMSIAGLFEAHLAGVAFAYEPLVPGSLFNGTVANLIAAQRVEHKKAAQDAVSRFELAANKAGLSTESHLIEAPAEEAGGTLARLARRFDLAVLPQAEPDKNGLEDIIIEAALFGSGRPVVVVPYIQKDPIKLDRVLVGWDGSRNATRAIADSLPILAHAKAIEVVIVSGEPGKPEEIAGADIAQHLARHSRKVDLKKIVTTDGDVANAILSHAADCSADFLVMGGYGHSRLREFVLGGATRGILSSMTVPVLMSH